MIRHNAIEETRSMWSQVRNVQIDQISSDMVIQRIHHIHGIHKLPIGLPLQHLSRVAVLDQMGGLEGVCRREFVHAREDDDGDAVGFGREGDGGCAGCGDQRAVGEYGVWRQDDFVDAGHESEDGGVGDEDDGDSELGESFPPSVFGAGLRGSADDGGVSGGVVVGVGFGVDDCEFSSFDTEAAFCCSIEKSLDCGAGCVGEDDLVVVDVIESGFSDLAVDNVQFFQEVVYSRADFGTKVDFLNFALCLTSVSRCGCSRPHCRRF